MKYGVSIFPDYADERSLAACVDYLRTATACGGCEAFSSLHLPETDMRAHIDKLAALGRAAAELGLEFSLDVSARVLRTLCADEGALRGLRAAPIDWLRLDYGFELSSALEAARMVGARGLMLNASVLTAQELETLIPAIRAQGGLRLRAHHNYYPRPETGLSLAFLCEKSELYKPYGLSVTACIACLENPRMPLFAGLPTVETQRNLPCELAALELRETGLIDTILFGDPFVPPAELRAVGGVCAGEPIALHILPAAGLSQQERNILFGGVHHARPDAAAFSVRSQSSREMASFGARIAPNHCVARERYTLTIDNERYGRYSGELQLLTDDLPADERVNVVGRVRLEDTAKVSYIRPGTDFILIE